MQNKNLLDLYQLKKNFNLVKNQFFELKEYISIDNFLKKKKYYESLTTQQNFWQDQKKAKEIIQKLNTITGILEAYTNLNEKEKEIGELIEIIEPENIDDLIELNETINEFKKNFEEFVYFQVFEDIDNKNAILTIHPGAGGLESTDWALMLFKMYIKFFDKMNFKYKIVEYTPYEGGGIKSTTIIVKGKFAYGFLKYEVGIHRLVRISPFDSNKRRHTSFCSIHCYPEMDEDLNIKINPSDLRIDTFRAQGAGGQHVNTTDSAVRITHIPTKITVTCQNERSQHKNKEIALKILKSRLYQFYKEKAEEEAKKNVKEKTDIAWGNQIRSYILHPYNLIKDHRTNFETTNVNEVFEGNIFDFIFEMIKLDFKNKLKRE